jgi:uncharacterized protein
VGLLKRVLLGLVALYLGLCALVFLVQRRLLYFPRRETEQAALERAARLGLAPWRDRHGILLGWRGTSSGRVARMLVLHGNAGSALDRALYAGALGKQGVEVTILEYPGYGPRVGSPSIGSLTGAALEAVRELSLEGKEPVWLLGESLGSGVAGRVVASGAVVDGLVLVTPFARLVDVVKRHYPILPSSLLRDRYEPAADLASFKGPSVLILAGEDEVVGVEQGRRLFAALGGRKRLIVQAGATHNGLDLEPGEALWREAVAFLREPRS